MKALYIIALLLVTIHDNACGQDTTASAWPLQAVQVDFALFPMGTSAALSWSGSVDIDVFVHKHSGGSVSLFGWQLGFSQFDWPYVEYGEDEHYAGNDYDFLIRHTYRLHRLRTDLITGLSIRDGEYENTRFGAEFGPREASVSAGIKVGGTITYMFIKPAIGLRLKANCRLFGFDTIEGGALGLGLVLGWQLERW